MIVLNKLTKNNTCESVDILHGEKGLISIEYGGSYYQGDKKIESANELLVTNHVAHTTYFTHIVGIIEYGHKYNFQSFNNKIKVTVEGEKPYRGVDR